MKSTGKQIWTLLVGAFLPFLLILGITSTAAAQFTGAFTPTGNMTTARVRHTATLLPDGKVLIAGGYFLADTPQGRRGISLASAELYDPATGTFSETGNMAAADSGPAAILLNDGKVLIAHSRNGRGAAPAELYDPVTGAFSATGDQLVIWSGTETVNLLPDGRVLLVICCTAEQLYDPASGTFSLTDRTKRIYQDGFGAAALTDGTVLFAGGAFEGVLASSGAVLYDPSSGSFRPTGDMTTGRYYHTVTSLPDGTVLIAGGEGNPSSNPTTATSAEIYDPATGAFSRTGDMTYGHTEHTATLLLDGRVLLTGGPARAEVYIPSVLMPIPVVRGVRFDRMIVPAGSSYSADFSGSSLTPEMFFDVRFTSPESNESAVALNWQKGFAENHEASAGVASGSWKITSVRAHAIETDHTGIFFPVSATITVP